MKRNQTTFLILFVMSVFFGTKTYSQESIVVAGGKGAGAGGTASYSVGQVSDLSLKGSGGSAHEGVQQAYEIATLGADEFKEINLVITAYPNPTIDVLNLIVSDNQYDDLSFTLFDINGKIVANTSKVISSETKVSMQGLAKGVYFLAVNRSSKAIKTFKIIKK
ncbi:T9SS type A sorting domain-containing protein [Flavobacterium sp. 3-218]